jgi:prefoldin subunit 5
LDEIEASYREKLQTLQRQLPVIESKINALNTLKDQFSELATPTPIKTKPQNPDN